MRKFGRVLSELIGLRECFLFAGTVCVARGVHEVHAPSAWIFVGLVLMSLAIRRGTA